MEALRPSAVRRASELVDAHVDAVFEMVETVRDQVVTLLRPDYSRLLRGADLRVLEPLLRNALSGGACPRLAGLGYIAAVGFLTDHERWLEWVRRTEDGSMTRLEPDLDPDSFGYYDFTAADWFRRPLATHGRSVVGPYVDFAGTDEYVVTLTVPVEVEGRVLGVAGADLRPGDLSKAVMPALCSIAADAVLLNAEGRVVVSNSSHWQIGSLLRGAPPTLKEDCQQAPWSVAAFEASFLP